MNIYKVDIGTDNSVIVYIVAAKSEEVALNICNSHGKQVETAKIDKIGCTDYYSSTTIISHKCF